MQEPICTSFDLNYRPASYFWPHSLETHLLASVKGAARQQHIRLLIDQGRMRELDAWIAAESLGCNDRRDLGRIHPSLMGGEYLPDLRRNEVEIARISLRSVTADVISVRATKGRYRIYYRIVDEYGGDNTGEHKTRSSIRPLTLGQLEEFIERASAGMGFIYYNYEGGSDLEELKHFITATSPFYSELEALYQARIAAGIASILAQRAEFDDEQEDCHVQP